MSAKVLTSILAIALLSLVGCGQPSSTDSESSQSDSPQETVESSDTKTTTKITHAKPDFKLSTTLPDPVLATTQSWNVSMVLKTSTELYWQRVALSGTDMGNTLLINVQVQSTENSRYVEFAGDQIDLISKVLTEESPNGLILGPADSQQLVSVVDQAAAQDIPVIAIDTPIESDNLLTFVGFDDFAAGKTMGEWVVEQLGEKGKVLVVQGAQNNANAVKRYEGFLAGLDTGDIEVLDSQSANWREKEAQELTAAWLEEYPEVDAIVAANDQMALGAITAIEAAGREDILVTGFNGSEAGLDAIQAGKLAASIDQLPEELTRIAVQLMVNYLEQREPLPKEVLLENTELITADSFL
ncbi:periplasmic binding protein/LacI transcriptional regulator [[Leptolyngbya] sp. PCC 7376]|uniref:sugar ABC transporter substrate-binding protein n=1 Tax=[Leptolyngbya] sp. PCC 7376 TaxID=111781 RepID=UPI00029EE508|nr:sugar ABC transporter substrate-binding protein [[Leptolyngbya] sp. PCC 7376]AFY37910.1 periplasmic binding protein/LacI transcriptional regulator [[Leptolyngbya] sp. PCC 7376]